MSKRTRTRDVTGFFFDGIMPRPARITVRVTKDKLGESISFAAEDKGVMLQIPCEPVADMIRVEAEE